MKQAFADFATSLVVHLANVIDCTGGKLVQDLRDSVAKAQTGVTEQGDETCLERLGQAVENFSQGFERLKQSIVPLPAGGDLRNPGTAEQVHIGLHSKISSKSGNDLFVEPLAQSHRWLHQFEAWPFILGVDSRPAEEERSLADSGDGKILGVPATETYNGFVFFAAW